MATNNDLRLLRIFLEQQRNVALSGLEPVNSAIDRRVTENKQSLAEQLQGLDEFHNSTHHEEYRPA
ncbi:hypothetical protein [Streptomyces sp. STR69]|uniref:hypothetical protein n=1 Tax=Streptomyces sp. STR69 TaxID=1796942 RepID=UPI0021C9B8FD|nr:hypothetical protein [Streptomyces sp. STR69]